MENAISKYHFSFLREVFGDINEQSLDGFKMPDYYDAWISIYPGQTPPRAKMPDNVEYLPRRLQLRYGYDSTKQSVKNKKKHMILI